jgi:hypothetical protein
VLDEEASEVEMSVDKMSVDVVKEGSEDEEIEDVTSVEELKGVVSVDISGEKDEESAIEVVE